jgi:hypothetical protein
MSELLKKLDNLRNAAIIQSVFYIPNIIKSLVGEEILSKFEKKDEILYFSSSIDFVFFDQEHCIDLIAKSRSLEINSINLLEYQLELDSKSFLYLAEKYLSTLEDYTILAKALLENYDDQSPDKSLKWKGLFITQDKYFNDHLHEVEKITGLIAKRVRNNQMSLYPISLENNQSLKNLTRHIKPFRSLGIAAAKNEDTDFIEGISISNKDEDFKKEIKAHKPLRDFLKHDNKIEIENLVEMHFANYRGVSLRYLIQFFEDKGWLIINYGDKAKLYRSFKELLGEKIGESNSIFNIPNFSNNDYRYRLKVPSFEIIFKKFL